MKKLITALLLLLCVMFTCMPTVSADSHADHTLTAETETDSILDDVAVKRYVNAAAFDSRQHVKRLPEKERLDTFVYNNIDGTQSTYYMSENVKYIDQRGEVVDKDTSLLKTKTGYTVRQNEYDLNIPFDAAEGVQIGFSGVKVSISPRGYEGKTVGAESGSAVVYKNCFGDGADLKYTPLLSGVKEDIIIYDHTGSEYSFVIKTNGAYICSDKNGYYISGNKNAARADGVMFIGDVIVYDAAGRPGTGKLTVEPVVDGKEYIAVISVDESFLTDEKTVYPVTIDPTITISDTANGSNSIEDTIVFSGYPNNNFYNYIFLTAGYTDDAHKIGRVAVRAPGLLNDETYASLTAGKIVTAVFGCFDSSGHGTQPVKLYRITSPWTETTATWNNLGSSYSTATDDWSADMPNALPTEFDITTLVKGWKSGTYNGSYGFMLVNSNESTQSLKKAPFSSEYPDDSKRPYIVITYQSHYGSIEGEYYLNNRYTGKYIHKNGSTAANGQSGLLSSLQNTVKWELRHHGNDVYSVRHKGSNYYLNVSGGSVRLTYYTHDSIANTAKWEMTTANGGGRLMRNVATNQYLYSSGTSLLLSSTLGTVGTSTYNSRAWRLANTAYYGNTSSYQYRELGANFSISNLTVNIGQSKTPSINKNPSNALLANPTDFTYSFNSSKISINSNTAKISASEKGNVTVTATHKPTGRVKTFIVNACPLLIYQTENTYYHDKNGNYAEDLDYSEMTMEDLCNLDWVSWMDFVADNPELRRADWESMCTTLFSTGDLEVVVLDMIDHFMIGSGTSYTNSTLTQRAYEHDSTQAYISAVESKLATLLNTYDGDISVLEYFAPTRGSNPLVQALKEAEVPEPVYNTLSDKINGLTICIDSLWGNKIEVTSYKLSGNTYTYTLHYTLYDHFGLNQEDVEEYGLLSGFRSWYVLQHYCAYNGAYKPFLTLIEFDVTVSGTYS